MEYKRDFLLFRYPITKLKTVQQYWGIVALRFFHSLAFCGAYYEVMFYHCVSAIRSLRSFVCLNQFFTFYSFNSIVVKVLQAMSSKFFFTGNKKKAEGRRGTYYMCVFFRTDSYFFLLFS